MKGQDLKKDTETPLSTTAVTTSVTTTVTDADPIAATGVTITGTSLSDRVLADAKRAIPVSYKELLKMDFESFQGKEITVFGWARSVRAYKARLFLQLYDNTCKKDLQVFVDKGTIPDDEFEAAAKGKTRWSFRVTGHVKLSPGAGQPWELVATHVTVLGESTDEYILQKRGQGLAAVSVEKLREYPHLRMQNYVFSAIARLRHRLAKSVHEYFDKLGFYWLATPVLSFSDCEGAGEAFMVTTDKEQQDLQKRAVHPATPIRRFFKDPAFLTVSGQLEGESGAMALSKIYTFGPTFRAEESDTSRHLPEFTMVEPELVDEGITIERLMTLGEKLVQYTITKTLEESQDEIHVLSDTFGLTSISKLQSYVEQPFVRLTYTDAIQLLAKHVADKTVEFETKPEWGIDLGSEHERYLTDTVFKCPVMLYRYPAAIKSFYMKKTPGCAEGRQTVEACDWLVPGVGELIGGSLREESYEVLKAEMERRGMDLKPYTQYLDIRRFGTAPHGGFGLGFERLVSFVGGIHNVRDCIPFPRWPGFQP
jgi:asparaginyl-tRNA synthetase